ncbi:hypothetical protein BDY21DRAFT_370145 [Lineolata rhizophorae]|uniref:Uncharacterized protein n=1 Tax=Lineolata rhizophorae TaxID=578093 RepID=A0A6A6P6B3_9PEZI|nr:hypothetical protein BDY21DRAFT_370145 [Lineolata rhizophorae]
MPIGPYAEMQRNNLITATLSSFSSLQATLSSASSSTPYPSSSLFSSAPSYTPSETPLRTSLLIHSQLISLLLLIPRRDLFDFAHSYTPPPPSTTDRPLRADSPAATTATAAVLAWLRADDGQRARRAVLAAAELLDSLRRHPAGAPHEPFAALVATVTLWAFSELVGGGPSAAAAASAAAAGSPSALQTRAEPHQFAVAMGAPSPFASAAGSAASPPPPPPLSASPRGTAAGSPSGSGVPATGTTPSWSPWAGLPGAPGGGGGGGSGGGGKRAPMIRLDRPRTAEATRAWIEGGPAAEVRGHLTDVGSVAAAEAGARVLEVG